MKLHSGFFLWEIYSGPLLPSAPCWEGSPSQLTALAPVLAFLSHHVQPKGSSSPLLKSATGRLFAGSLSSVLSLCRAWFLFSLVSDPREPTAVGYSHINPTKGKSAWRQWAAAQRDSVTDGIIATIMSD